MARSKIKLSEEPPRRSALATRITDKWARSGEEVELDRLVSELGDVQRYDLVAALKELEKAGAGAFVAARAGRKARFQWSAKKARSAGPSGPAVVARGATPVVKSPKPTASAPSVNILKARQSSTKVLPSKTPRPAPREGMVSKAVKLANASKHRLASAIKAPAIKPTSSSLEHVFHLRPGYLATIRLPSDVTAEEMERFCQFLRVLPFRVEP